MNNINYLGEGEFFGHDEFFQDCKRKYSVRCIEFTTVYAISRTAFITIIKPFKRDYEKFCQMKD